jgi:hypothetical protein
LATITGAATVGNLTVSGGEYLFVGALTGGNFSNAGTTTLGADASFSGTLNNTGSLKFAGHKITAGGAYSGAGALHFDLDQYSPGASAAILTVGNASDISGASITLAKANTAGAGTYKLIATGNASALTGGETQAATLAGQSTNLWNFTGSYANGALSVNAQLKTAAVNDIIQQALAGSASNLGLGEAVAKMIEQGDVAAGAVGKIAKVAGSRCRWSGV